MGQCYNSTIVDAPIDTVWETIRDFHDMSWGSQVITKLDKVGEIDGSRVGAGRILNEAFHETLVSIDDKNFSFDYSIDDGPGPVAKEAVSDYVGSVKLHPVTDTGQTLVVWSSVYRSAADQAVGDFCNPIYQALLAALKNSFNS
jgi:hypothetical protein